MGCKLHADLNYLKLMTHTKVGWVPCWVLGCKVPPNTDKVWWWSFLGKCCVLPGCCVHEWVKVPSGAPYIFPQRSWMCLLCTPHQMWAPNTDTSRWPHSFFLKDPYLLVWPVYSWWFYCPWNGFGCHTSHISFWWSLLVPVCNVLL